MRRRNRNSKNRMGQSPSWNRKTPDHCDCSGFGQDVSLPAQTLQILESVVVIVRQTIKTLDILLMTPLGGLCKNIQNESGSKLGKAVSDLLPLNIIG